MDWKKLLCEKRQCNQSNKNNKKNNNDMRNEFQKDYHFYQEEKPVFYPVIF